MTAPRLFRGVCLLLLLTAATGLVASASAHSEEQGPPHSPTLLWQTFPLRQRAVHQFAATSHVATAARKATTERNAKAERSAKTKGFGSAPNESTTFPRVVAVVMFVGMMLAALALFAARRSHASSAESTGAEIVGYSPAPLVRPTAEAPEPGAPRPSVRPAPTSTPRREVAPDRPPAQQPEVERCEIVLWTGYVKKQFYAAPSGIARTLEPLPASSYFRLRDTDVPGARAERALDDLLRRLERAGWQIVSKGARWYHYRLERLPWHGEAQPAQAEHPPTPVVRPAAEEPGAPRPSVRPAPEPSTPRREVAPDRPPAQQPEVERCEIVLWTGYVKKQFYAAPSGIARTLEPLPASSYFRLRDTDVPGARAKRALEDLLRRLEHAGWQIVSKGARWYHYRLERLPWHGEAQPARAEHPPAPPESRPLESRKHREAERVR